MILDDKILINITNRNKKHYADLGYDVSEKQIYVSPLDIPNGSKTKIHVKCDNDGIESWQQKTNYMKITHNDTEPYYCKNCMADKLKSSMQKLYGVDNCSQLEKIKEKKMMASQKRYGCDYVSQAAEVREKIVQTNMERYGSPCVLTNPEIHKKVVETCISKYGTSLPTKNEQIKNKIKNTVMDRYNVSNIIYVPEIKLKIEETNMLKYNSKSPFGSKEVRDKRKQTFLKKWGKEEILQVPEVIEKSHKTMSKNGTCKTSRQQIYIGNIYHGVLNYPCKNYSLDIYLEDNKIDVEIDFGGHDLSVKLGHITKEEFAQKQIIRNNIVKREGIKIMRIISQKDWCPSDKILLQMLDFARNYFSTTKHTWIEFDIDAGTYYNAEHKEGEPYDFGELRKIKASDIESQTA